MDMGTIRPGILGQVLVMAVVAILMVVIGVVVMAVTMEEAATITTGSIAQLKVQRFPMVTTIVLFL